MVKHLILLKVITGPVAGRVYSSIVSTVRNIVFVAVIDLEETLISTNFTR